MRVASSQALFLQCKETRKRQARSGVPGPQDQTHHNEINQLTFEGHVILSFEMSWVWTCFVKIVSPVEVKTSWCRHSGVDRSSRAVGSPRCRTVRCSDTCEPASRRLPSWS